MKKTSHNHWEKRQGKVTVIFGKKGYKNDSQLVPLCHAKVIDVAYNDPKKPYPGTEIDKHCVHQTGETNNVHHVWGRPYKQSDCQTTWKNNCVRPVNVHVHSASKVKPGTRTSTSGHEKFYLPKGEGIVRDLCHVSFNAPSTKVTVAKAK